MVTQEVIQKLIVMQEALVDESAAIQKQISDLMLKQSQLQKDHQDKAHKLISDEDFDIADKLATPLAESYCLEFTGETKVTHQGIVFEAMNALGEKDSLLIGFFNINNYKPE